MRWMKSSSYDPVNDVVIFTELDGDTPLQLQAAQFLEDLKRGLSAPNQPDEATNELVSELRAAA
jgi:hypothetical protein